MKHLVAIYDLVKRISTTKKKMQNDPLGSRAYEKEIWTLYQKVTDHKDAYYFDKLNSVPHVKNAYVTFRSMEGKHRALQAWETPDSLRVFVEYICCMKSVFKKKKLLSKGYPHIRETANPEAIVWENLGQKRSTRVFVKLAVLLIAAAILACTFFVMWYFALYEKMRVGYVKSDCYEGDYSQGEALADLARPAAEQQGLMHCFCS